MGKLSEEFMAMNVMNPSSLDKEHRDAWREVSALDSTNARK